MPRSAASKGGLVTEETWTRPVGTVLNWPVLSALAVLIGLLCRALFALPLPDKWRAFLLGMLIALRVVGELVAVHSASVARRSGGQRHQGGLPGPAGSGEDPWERSSWPELITPSLRCARW
jgi:hypothetical protein